MNFLTIIGAIIGIPAIMACLSILRGWVLSILWTWFLVPLGMPVLSIPFAIGVALVVAFLTLHAGSKKDYEFGESIAISVVASFLFLFIGWIVKFFL